ncbi:MAG: hypothetical protein LBS99_05860, partial [Clostridiales bacterium]|jgi:hypothetical protein|nr:hypothetical protein [Clostridiales bacterium]
MRLQAFLTEIVKYFLPNFTNFLSHKTVTQPPYAGDRGAVAPTKVAVSLPVPTQIRQINGN